MVPWLVAAALYAVAAALLLVRLGDGPPFPHNWEEYTAWRVFAGWHDRVPDPFRVFALTDGLMTDSGQGPLVGAPAALGFRLGGVGLLPLRLPVALVTAAAAPLLWLVGRRVADSGTALLAALLLALSPAFLFYGRTATLVGVSLVPALLTVLALVGVLAAETPRAASVPPRRAAALPRHVAPPPGKPSPPGGSTPAAGPAPPDERVPGPAAPWSRWAWLAALEMSLVAGAYAYAPVRLLWPIAVGALVLAAVLDPARRRWRLGAAAATAIALPLALVAIDAGTTTEPDPWGAVSGYFRVRGEQLWGLAESTDGFAAYVRPSPAEAALGGVRGGNDALRGRLVAQNAGDLLRLLADRETRPLPTDHWNAQGRFWPALLVPFFLVGAAATVARAIVHRRPGAWLLLLLAAGLTLPLLLTTRVHVGRLVPALPVLLLLVAVGAGEVGRAAAWAVDWFGRVRGGSIPVQTVDGEPGDAVAAMAAAADDGTTGATAANGTVGAVGGVVSAGVVSAGVVSAGVVSAGVAVALLALVGMATAREFATPVAEPREARTAAALQALATDPERALVAWVEPDDLGLEVERVHAAAVRLLLDGAFRFVDLEGAGAAALAGERTAVAGEAAGGRPRLVFGGVLGALEAGTLPGACGAFYAVAPAAEAAFLDALGGDRAALGCAGTARYAVLPE